MVDAGELLEHARVFDNFYGTPKKAVEDAMAAGKDVMFDVDWQGTQQLVEHDPEDLVRVFLLPPSYEELESRLRNRKQDSDEVVRNRMKRAGDEMSHYIEYDYVLVNNDLETCVAEVQNILKVEHLRRVRQTGLHDFVESLQRAK
jgi:guanylate kinase